MAKTSPAERRQVRLQQRRVSRVFSRALAFAAPTVARARVAAVEAFRRGISPSAPARNALGPLLEVAVGAMMNAHLLGATTVPVIERQTFAMQSGFETSVEFLRRRSRLSPEKLAVMESAYGREAVKILTNLDTAVDRKLQRVMTEIRTENLHVRDGVKRLREAFDRLGLTPDNRFTLEAIFRTQTQMALSAGQRSLERDPVVNEILWGYKYVTAGDSRVRPEHAALEGVTLPKDDPAWDSITPPNGYGCRCQLIPLFEERAVVDVPEPFEVDGVLIQPGADRGFEFNPGDLLDSLRSV